MIYKKYKGKVFKEANINKVMNQIKFRIIIEQDENNIFIAQCPTLPGCISQGKTRFEAIKNIKDAIEGYLESLKKHNEPIPPSIQEEVVEIYA